MSFDPQLTPRKQIRNLLFILFSGIACAILLTMFMLYNYGPAGHYVLGNTLLSPEVINQMTQEDANDKKSVHKQTFMDHLEFSHQDIDSKKMMTYPIDEQTYAKFYQMVIHDKSLDEIPTSLSASFNQMPSSTLTIRIQKRKVLESSNEKQIFQEVQFLYKGDYYRLQLRDTSGSQWVYFYHPHIYEDVFILFTGAKI